VPVYTVTTEMGRLDQEQKERLATGITGIHGEETGASEPLIHVLFLSYPKHSAWSSSKPGSPILVSASLRSGRSEDIRQRMLQRINDLICEVTQISARNVIVTLFDCPSHWAMEAGMVTPGADPVAEAAWNREFSARFPANPYA